MKVIYVGKHVMPVLLI